MKNFNIIFCFINLRTISKEEIMKTDETAEFEIIIPINSGFLKYYQNIQYNCAKKIFSILILNPFFGVTETKIKYNAHVRGDLIISKIERIQLFDSSEFEIIRSVSLAVCVNLKLRHLGFLIRVQTHDINSWYLFVAFV